jgi:hypothetical protein
MIRTLLTATLLLVGGCTSVRTDPPPVQPSSTAAATFVITVSQGGIFTPPCTIVQTGATIEWRNLTPLLPIDMVSTAAPFEISSPALLSPYNEVPPSQSDMCAVIVDGICTEKQAYSYWRHTFKNAGVFDYFDSVGTAVAPPASNEYGMPTGSTTTTAISGTVCVLGSANSDACNPVCCITGSAVNQCPAGVMCIGDRCGGVTLPPGGSL